MDTKQILTIATEVGYMMLKYGGEVYRAEQSARYICNYYGITQVDVFAIPNSIVVTITDGDDFITKTRRITESAVDLTKIDHLNTLSRQIGVEKPSYSEILTRLAEIDAIQPYPDSLRMAGAALVALGFAMLFGATYVEALIAALASVTALWSQILLKELYQNSFIKTASSSLIISLIAHLALYFSNGTLRVEPIIAGALMILVPGLALTNCMRDFMANDYVSGITRFTEAMMTALATALGVALVILTYPM